MPKIMMAEKIVEEIAKLIESSEKTKKQKSTLT
jgi:hypothetical protein